MKFDEWLKENAAFINACSFEKERLRIAYVGGKRSALANQWISVEDRLPVCDQRVFVSNGEDIYTSYFCEEYFQCDHFNLDLSDAAHWMPIPEPPK